MILKLSDDYFMKQALEQALRAYEQDEVPVGAVVVHHNKIIARAHNLTEQLNDVTAHAEMQAITSAFNFMGGKYLNECSLYVTLEPCAMCASALSWAQLGKLVYGASDKQRGYSQFSPLLLHKKTIVQKHVMEQDCSELLKKFFKTKRN